MHYLDKPHRPSLRAMGWVGFQSATPTKVGQNSTGVDNGIAQTLRHTHVKADFIGIPVHWDPPFRW